MSKKRKALWVGLVLIVAAAPAYGWLFTESTVPSTGQFSIDLAQLRALANSLPGEKPTEIRFEQVGSMKVPITGVVAGAGWSETSLTFYAFQLRYPDHTAMIDSAMDRKTAEATGAKDFDDGAFARIGQALAVADPIVLTHEHYDHIGGVTVQPNLKALMPRLKLTKEQLSVPKKMVPLVFPADALAGYVPLSYEKMTAVAPGVVLLKAPGHTPGTQLVFVQRADGAEYLFLGDVAWHWRNVAEVRTRARLVTLLIGEDRDGVLRQLQELHRLGKDEPKLQLVPGHDQPRIEQLVAGGFLKAGFEVAR
ncbi:MAG: fold metallo-hydrolase [Myxococcaceae bacterium]|nr:fold metallo-hydrolase [Myxococcaceae bacterium]